MLSILLQSGLFIWFILSFIWFVPKDQTLALDIKIFGEIINLFCLGYISANMSGQNHGILFWQLGIMLIVWYFYITPKDLFNPDYTPVQRNGFVAIDITFIIYLIITLTLSSSHAYLNKFTMINQLDQIKNLNFGIF